MKNKLFSTKQSLLFLLVASLLVACGEEQESKNRGAIVMNDPATIVTETDKKYLTDFVEDIHLKEVPVVTEDSVQKTESEETEEKKSEPTVIQENKPTVKANTGKGLSIDFNEIQVFIPNVEIKSSNKQQPEKKGAASYQVVKGNLAANTKMQVTGSSKDLKIEMRYISTVLFENEWGSFQISSLGKTSDWLELKGANGNFSLKMLQANSIETKKNNPTQIRQALIKAISRKRLSKAQKQQFEKLKDRIHSVQQEPLKVAVRSVMWKIQFKDEKGKPKVKQLRLDLPI